MPSQLEFKKRIASTKSLQKIFSAQELIAASRISKARTLAEEALPYAQAITDAVVNVATHTSIPHPLTCDRKTLGRKPSGRVAVFLVTADRGMAGAYSATIIRETEKICNKLQEDGKEPVLFVSGRRGKSYYAFRGREVQASWEGNSDAPEASRAAEIADTLVDAFLSKDETKAVDELLIVSTEFINMVSQKPRIIRMLPLSIEDKSDYKPEVELENSSESVDNSKHDEANKVFPLYTFEPSAEDVLDTILPRYVRSRIHECLLESAASETASRQRAMHTATDNAKDLINDLVLRSNKARQAAITQELTEIVASADALNTD